MLDPLPDLGPGARPVSLPGPLIDQLPQIRDLGLPGWHRELREQDLAEFEVDVGPLRNEKCVVAGPGEVVRREQGAHLGGGLQVMVVALESEPGRIAAQRPGLDAEQDVVSVVLGAMCVVGVVGGEQRRTDLAGDLQQVGHDRLLGREPVVLDLDEEPVFSEDVLEPGGRRRRRFEVTNLPLVAFLAHRVRSQ